MTGAGVFTTGILGAATVDLTTLLLTLACLLLVFSPVLVEARRVLERWPRGGPSEPLAPDHEAEMAVARHLYGERKRRAPRWPDAHREAVTPRRASEPRRPHGVDGGRRHHAPRRAVANASSRSAARSDGGHRV